MRYTVETPTGEYVSRHATFAAAVRGARREGEGATVWMGNQKVATHKEYERIPLQGDKHGRSALVRLRDDGLWEGFVGEIGSPPGATAAAHAKSDVLCQLRHIARRHDAYYPD